MIKNKIIHFRKIVDFKLFQKKKNLKWYLFSSLGIGLISTYILINKNNNKKMQENSNISVPFKKDFFNWNFSHYLPNLLISLTNSKILFIRRKAIQSLIYLTKKDDPTIAKLLREGILNSFKILIKENDPYIVIYIFKSIENLSKREITKQTILLDGWINIFESYSMYNNKDILISITKSLENLTKFGDIDPKISNLIINNDKNISNILNNLSNSSIEQINLLIPYIIINLSSIDNFSNKIIKEDFINYLFKISMKKEQYQIEVAKSLSEISKHEFVQPSIIKENWLTFFRKWAVSNNKNLRLYTAKIFSHLIENDENAIILIRKLGLDFFISLADIPDIDVQHTVERVFNTLRKNMKQDSTLLNNKDIYMIDDNFTLN